MFTTNDYNVITMKPTMAIHPHDLMMTKLFKPSYGGFAKCMMGVGQKHIPPPFFIPFI